MANNADPLVQALFGVHARCAAFNYVVQRADEKRAAVIGNTSFADAMSFGASPDAPHVLVLCDVVIRPHLVIESRHLVGVGAAGILTSDALANPSEWLEHGRVVLDNMPRTSRGVR